MSITVETEKGVSRIKLMGELTIFGAGELWPPLQQALKQAKEAEIDLNGISEIDTAGIQLLMMAKKSVEKMGVKLRMHNHSPSVLEVLELYDLAGYFGDPLVLHSD